MRILTWLPVLIAVASITLLLSTTSVSAEQIRLADGRFLQGSVSDVTEEGFTFTLTESGGRVFLRWNQVDEKLKKRLRNEKDPDEDLNLSVTVDGARLELISGAVFEGKIALEGKKYSVKNFVYQRGRQIDRSDVMDDGYIPDIQIEATVMMSEEDALAMAEQRRAPLETARQFYELARIADRYALYESAKDYVTLALAASPDAKLQARLDEFGIQLEELIRQQGVLNALAAARKLAKKKYFQLALDKMEEANKEFEPTGPVLDKYDEVFTDIDLDYTRFVITEWYKAMKIVATKKAKEKETTVQEVLRWVGRPMEQEIQDIIAEKVGSEEAKEMKDRFLERFDLEEAGDIKLNLKKIGFTKEGYYQLVGGNLNVGGKKAQSQNDPRRNNRNNRNNPIRPRGRNDSVGQEIDDILKKAIEAERADRDGFQEGDDLPEAPSAGGIEEWLRRYKEEQAKRKAAAEAGNKSPGTQDLSKLKTPSTYPSLADWYLKKASRSTKTKWLTALYVLRGGTMRIFVQKYWDIKYK